MLYDRKIKYVDYYENGERVKGGGFVKLEVRDGFLTMDLHIKGLYPTDSFVRDVVLSGSETEVVLGRITLQEGVGCFSYSCKMTEGIGSTGISYEDLREIKIPVGGSRELCCAWGRVTNKAARPAESLETESLGRESSEPESAESDSSKPGGMAEMSLTTRGEGARLQETESQGAGVHKTEAQETDTQEAEVQEGVAQETEVQEREAGEAVVAETVTQQTVVSKPTIRETSAKETAVQETAAQETVVQTAELQQAEALKSEPCETENAASVPEHQEPANKEINQRNEKPAPEPQVSEGSGQQKNRNESEQKPAVKLLEDKWQQLSAIYPHIKPFDDEREYLSLSPSDFVLFPESYYRAANNSFLLHGFYNYKHLILARVERRSEVRYYLGVPGNYYEREKQVAVMFGFESFECDREPAKTGDFGYYLMRMEL
ncbi:MAG: hypothetical protein J1E01_01700 [Acetatifactor sp.]|nr:hypothetical protein [Acetatifactor sp.]